jgi:hypothetical protein
LCRTGNFNLSHASLTSAQALSALRELPTTNPTLYSEITRSEVGDTMTDNEPAFSADIQGEDDGCDIPVDIIRSVIMSEGSVVAEGFKIDDRGSIVRMGDVEEFGGAGEKDEENELPPVVLGRGHRAKIGSMRYDADWEEH